MGFHPYAMAGQPREGLLKKPRRRQKTPYPPSCFGQSFGNLSSGEECWEVSGDLREKYYAEVHPKLCERLFATFGTASISDWITLAVYMVGRDRTDARPTVMICSADEKNCKSAKKEIKKSGILDQNARFKVVCAAEDPGMRNMEQLAADENENNKELPSPLIYSTHVLMEKSAPIQPLGMRIWVDHVSSLRPSTAFVCHIKGHTFLRTVYHAFSTPNSQPRFTEKAAVYVYPDSDSDSDTDSDSGFEPGPGSEDSSEFNVSITRIGSRSPDNTSDNDSRSDSPTPSMASETSTFSSLPQVCDKDVPDLPIISSGWEPSDNSYPIRSTDTDVQPPRSSLIVLGKLAFWSVDKDWALIEISNEEHKLSFANSMADSDLEPISIASLRNDVEVITHTPMGDTLRGTLSALPLCSRLPNSTSFQDLYRVTFSGDLENGDCGSAVRHANTGELCGHLIAGSRVTRMAYIMTASVVRRDFEMLPLEKSHGLHHLPRKNKLEGVDQKHDMTRAPARGSQSATKLTKSWMGIKRLLSSITRTYKVQILSQVLERRNFINAPFIVKASTQTEDLDRFLQVSESSSLSRSAEYIRKFCEINKSYHGQKLETTSEAWVCFQSVGTRLDEEYTGLHEESIGSLSAVQFTRLLTSQRAGLDSRTDSFRHLIQISGLNSDFVIGLIRTAWNYEAPALRGTIQRYLEKRASIRVDLPPTRFGALSLELHLPYLACRPIPKVSSDPTTDGETSNDDPWFDLSFLEISESQDRPDRYAIYEIQGSVLVCAWDCTKWSAYSFTTSVLEEQTETESQNGENEPRFADIDEQKDMDDFIDTDGSVRIRTWNPVVYYLAVMHSRVSTVVDEWNYLFETVAPAIKRRNSFFRHNILRDTIDIVAAPRNLNHITVTVIFLRKLRNVISDTNQSWKRFVGSGDMSYFKELGNSEVLFELSRIKSLFTELKLLEKKIDALYGDCNEEERTIQWYMTRKSNKLNQESIGLNRELIQYNTEVNSFSIMANAVNLESYRLQRSAAQQPALRQILLWFFVGCATKALLRGPTTIFLCLALWFFYVLGVVSLKFGLIRVGKGKKRFHDT